MGLEGLIWAFPLLALYVVVFFGGLCCIGGWIEVQPLRDKNFKRRPVSLYVFSASVAVAASLLAILKAFSGSPLLDETVLGMNLRKAILVLGLGTSDLLLLASAILAARDFNRARLLSVTVGSAVSLLAAVAGWTAFFVG
jgi:hypothetical protein